MLRRNFLRLTAGAMVAGSTVDLVAAGKNVGRSQMLPTNFRWSDERNVWTVDEFIKIYLKNGQDAVYDKYRFTLLPSGNCCVHITLPDEKITEQIQFVPLDTKENMWSKDEFVKQVKRSHKKDTIYFEIFNEDKSKSNLLAFWNNE